MKKSGVLSVLLILAMLAICFVPAAGATKAADAAASVDYDGPCRHDREHPRSIEPGGRHLKDHSRNDTHLLVSG